MPWKVVEMRKGRTPARGHWPGRCDFPEGVREGPVGATHRASWDETRVLCT